MHATFALAALASVASVATAQKQFVPQEITTLTAAFAAGVNGYGRFPCTQVNGDGSFSPLPNNPCANLQPIAGGSYDGFDGGNRPAPTGAQCVQQAETGAYFCGIAGAACTTDSNCDNGVCSGGVCTGGFDESCGGDNANCEGFLFCTNGDFPPATTASNTCGGVGSYCQSAYSPASSSSNATDANLIYNQYCASSYCSLFDGVCKNRLGRGVNCENDPYGCDDGLECSSLRTAGPDGVTEPVPGAVCLVEVGPSQRARSRRADITRRNLCPASHTACTVEGAKGFECIDVSSNIEQCGACASAGGVDCTAIEGVAAVGCVAGVCEIWSCEDGFSFDADKAACVAL
ncbi:hypothetical protein JCM8115_004786 [Rhodotorula mucilaginosa]|uniref:Protein CPL1-like domain-containing protein n=1 Tax=Rhodotorula mucilaginosa TaxID=5537 RepID=A0A9P6VZ15_RHOMI|nr:hypothetical protein C6P46_006061 [Rhodotorula mucilaginosa]TKA58328.1 hypothetical protein B0A53_00066 [Rhodotorula sp. CCFEE 5036]